MRRGLSIFLSAIILCGVMISPVKAISENHCAVFQEALYELQWFIGEKDIINIKETEMFPAHTIIDYTFYMGDYGEVRRFDWNEECNYYTCSAIPADAFETAAKSLFNIVNIDELRHGKGSIENIQYTETTDEYVVSFPGGWGGAASYKIHGYTEDNGKYITYGYVGLQNGEKSYLETIARFPEQAAKKGYVYTGETLLDGDKEILVIEAYWKAILSYDGKNVKYHSLEAIDSLPAVNGLVTPDSKVDAPKSTTTTTTTAKNLTSSKPDQSTGTTPAKSMSTTLTNTATTRTVVENQSPSKPDQSTDATTDTVVPSQASTYEEQTAAKTRSTQSVVENNPESGSDDVPSTKPQGNNAPTIIAIVSVAIVLLGGAVVCYFFVLKRKN